MTDKTHEYSKVFEIAAQVTAIFIAAFISTVAIAAILSDNSKIVVDNIEVMINPNDAPLGSLVRLRNIGIGKASAIIAYREKFKKHGNRIFASPKDLEKVKGIGHRTVEDNIEYLKFD